MEEHEAGPGQLVVVYQSVDTDGEVPQVGTAGNMFFEGGGQFATQLGAIVVHARPA